MIYIVTVLVVVALVQSWLLWRLVRLMGQMAQFDDRLTRCTQGLNLLVDTTEAGFAMLGGELGKVSAAPPPRAASRTTTRRIVSAAKRGRSVPEIAAREGLSEGEVRLRMHLADTPPADTPARSGDRRGPVRP